MLSYSGTQDTIAASAYKEPLWLFEVYEYGSGTPDYYWSTQDCSYSGQGYSFKIIPESFAGIKLSRAKTEFGLQVPNKASFTVSNSGNTLVAADFDECKVHIKLVVSDGSNQEIMGEWVLIPETTPNVKQQTLEFSCIDYVSRYLKTDYPVTPLIADLFPLSSTQYGNPNDNMCVPVIFGTAYIPLRPIYTDTDRFYLLGEAGPTYTISQVRSPRAYGANPSYWNSGSYSFTQYSKTGSDSNSYRVFQPIIADSDSDGNEDSCGVWANGNYLHDMPTKFYRSDTSSMNDFADIIEQVLLDIGVPSAMINSSSFSTASSTYSGWGLTADQAGFFYKRPVKEVLAELLAQCHSTLTFTDQINLVVLDNASRATVDDSDILEASKDNTSFTSSYVQTSEYDSAYVAIAENGEPIDSLNKILIPAEASTANISSDCLQCPFITDTQDGQRAGIMHIQRKFGKQSSGSFKSKATLLKIQPDDTITISHTDYGGTYTVLVDTLTIGRDLVLAFGFSRYKWTLDDWTDLSPSAVNWGADSTAIAWTPILQGPDGTVSSGYGANILTGRLRVGVGTNYILLDPTIGVKGIDSVLGTTFYLPIDGSAPEFSSGIIKEAEYQIYTSGVLKTADNPASTGGMVINNNGIHGYTSGGSLFFDVDLTTETVTLTNSISYDDLLDLPTQLSDINSTEGAKLTGIEDSATAGATWDSDITGQPADPLILNELNGIGAYQGTTFPYVNKSFALDCFVNTPGATGYYYKVASISSVSGNDGISWNGLLSWGGSYGRFLYQSRIRINVRHDSGSGNFTTYTYQYSGSDPSSILIVEYDNATDVVIFWVYTASYSSVLMNGVWSASTSLVNTWIWTDSSDTSNTGDPTYRSDKSASDPTSYTLITPSANYDVGATVGATWGTNISNQPTSLNDISSTEFNDLSDAFLKASDTLDDITNGSSNKYVDSTVMSGGYVYYLRITADTNQFLRITSGVVEGYVNGYPYFALDSNGGDPFCIIGYTGAEHVKTSSTGIQIKDNTTVRATFASTITLGLTSAEHLNISSSGLQFYDNTNELLQITSSGITAYTGFTLNYANGDFAITGSGGQSITMTSGNISFTGTVTFQSASGYSNISDKPTSLSGINSGEGTKLTGIETGATAGATWGTNISNEPTSLSGINSTEGTKLTGIETGATAGATFGSNVTGWPAMGGIVFDGDMEYADATPSSPRWWLGGYKSVTSPWRGTYCLRLTNDASGGSTHYAWAKNPSGAYLTYPVNTGDIVSISAWLKGFAADSGTIYIYARVGDKTASNYQYIGGGFGGSAGVWWEKQHAAVVTLADAAFVQVYVGASAYGAGGYSYVDNVRVDVNKSPWQHATDQTKIDGGNVYTGTIVATALNVSTLSAITANCGTLTAGTIYCTTFGGQTAGNYEIIVGGTGEEDGTGSYVKVQEIIVGVGGTLRIKFDLSRAYQSETPWGTTTCYGRVYRNGSPVGTERSTTSSGYVTFSEDISGWSNADLCQLYVKAANMSPVYHAPYRYFGLYSANPVEAYFNS